jgi:hypothetical protein
MHEEIGSITEAFPLGCYTSPAYRVVVITAAYWKETSYGVYNKLVAPVFNSYGLGWILRQNC